MLNNAQTTNKFFTLYNDYKRLDGTKRADKFQELCLYAYKTGGGYLLDKIIQKEVSHDHDIVRALIIGTYFKNIQ